MRRAGIGPVADKEPSLGALWAWTLAFNLAAALLGKVRPWLGLIVVSLPGAPHDRTLPG
jgi:hypothetical protein